MIKFLFTATHLRFINFFFVARWSDSINDCQNDFGRLLHYRFDYRRARLYAQNSLVRFPVLLFVHKVIGDLNKVHTSGKWCILVWTFQTRKKLCCSYENVRVWTWKRRRSYQKFWFTCFGQTRKFFHIFQNLSRDNFYNSYCNWCICVFRLWWITRVKLHLAGV